LLKGHSLAQANRCRTDRPQAVDGVSAPSRLRNALRALRAAGDAAGLNGDGLEPVGLHDLRHSLVAGARNSTQT
jgi:integrase